MDPKHYLGMTALGAACIAVAFFQNVPGRPGDRVGLTAPSTAATAGTQPVTGDVPAGLAPIRPTVTPTVASKPKPKPTPAVQTPAVTPPTATPAVQTPVANASTPPTGTEVTPRSGEGPAVKGTITFGGEFKNKLIRPDSDPVCSETWKGRELRKDTTTVTDGKLRDVIVYISKGLPAGQTWRVRDDEVVLDQKDCIYSPHVLGLQIGQPLKIKNSDPTSHNIHFKSKLNGEWNMSQNEPGIVDPKEPFKRSEMGTAVFKCDQHTWMEARLGIFDHPFFDVTGADGTFELPGDLPPGKYTLTAWHEQWKTLEQAIEVTAGGTVEVNLAFASKR